MEGEEKKDKAEAVEILGGSSYQLVCEGQSADDSTSAERTLRILEGTGSALTIVRGEAVTDSSSEESCEDTFQERFTQFYEKYTRGLQMVLLEMDLAQIGELANALIDTRARRARIYVIGNGGSAAAASHIAADFSNVKHDNDRFAFRITSLADNVAAFSAASNDFGYESGFVNQLRGRLDPGDLVIAISSSGNSRNVVDALQYANSQGASTWAIVGFTGGALEQCAEHSVYIPTAVGQYGFMEDVTSILNHILSIFIYEEDSKSTMLKEDA